MAGIIICSIIIVTLIYLFVNKINNENKEDFADLSILLEMRKVDFRSFVNHMIQKHLNEKPS